MRHWWAVGAFVLLLQKIGTHRTENPYRKKAVENNFIFLAREACLRSEGATLKRALQTWDELWRTLLAARIDPADLDVHFIAAFARESPAPQRVYIRRWNGLLRIFPWTSWQSVWRGSASPGSSSCGGQAYIDDLVARPDHDHSGLVCDHGHGSVCPPSAELSRGLGRGNADVLVPEGQALGEQGWFLLVYSKTYRVTSCIACFAFHHLILERAHMSDPQRHCMPMHSEAVKWTSNTAAGVVGKWSSLLLLTSNTYVYTTVINTYIIIYIYIII